MNKRLTSVLAWISISGAFLLKPEVPSSVSENESERFKDDEPMHERTSDWSITNWLHDIRAILRRISSQSIKGKALIIAAPIQKKISGKAMIIPASPPQPETLEQKLEKERIESLLQKL